MKTFGFFRAIFWVFLLLIIHCVRRIFIVGRFNIPADSMQPTLVPGNRMWVNKLLFGGRIYSSFNFEDHATPKCFLRNKKDQSGAMLSLSNILWVVTSGPK
jgi:signal peptidase I